MLVDPMLTAWLAATTPNLDPKIVIETDVALKFELPAPETAPESYDIEALKVPT